MPSDSGIWNWWTLHSRKMKRCLNPTCVFASPNPLSNKKRCTVVKQILFGLMGSHYLYNADERLVNQNSRGNLSFSYVRYATDTPWMRRRFSNVAIFDFLLACFRCQRSQADCTKSKVTTDGSPFVALSKVLLQFIRGICIHLAKNLGEHALCRESIGYTN